MKPKEFSPRGAFRLGGGIEGSIEASRTWARGVGSRVAAEGEGLSRGSMEMLLHKSELGTNLVVRGCFFRCFRYPLTVREWRSTETAEIRVEIHPDSGPESGRPRFWSRISGLIGYGLSVVGLSIFSTRPSLAICVKPPCQKRAPSIKPFRRHPIPTSARTPPTRSHVVAPGSALLRLSCAL